MKDNFSKQASEYAKFRPTYPAELFQFIFGLVQEKTTAWDCATGNGQIAAELAKVFEQVYATDISEDQLFNAARHPNITYSKHPAEATDFADNSFDLITVGQAVHWFRFDGFFKEVDRVLRPGGVLALIGYSLITCNFPEVNALIHDFYKNKTDPYWDQERKYVDEHYRSIPFPYTELDAPNFSMPIKWNLAQLTGYLFTWSAVQHYIKKHGENPVEELQKHLEKVWPASEKIEFRFPLFARIGHKTV